MRIKSDFMLREVGGTSMVVALGHAAEAFGGVVRLNPTAVFLFKLFQKGSSRQAAVEAVITEYGVARAMADAAVKVFDDDMTRMGMWEGA